MKGSGDGRPGNAFDRYCSALKHLAELRTRRDTEEQKSVMLEQLATYLSVTVPDPSNHSPFLLIRREASIAAQAVKQTVND